MVFEKLEKRLTLKFEIEALTPLHIGSGKPEFEPTAVDLPVIKNVASIPYIPGSSIKGKVRSEAERIARQWWPERKVCDAPYVDRMCGAQASSEEELCVICKIFGTATGGAKGRPAEGLQEQDLQELYPSRPSGKKGISRASKVKFRDAFVIGGPPKMEVRHGVAIDRKTGAAAEGQLYDVEAVPVGTKFDLEVVCENIDEKEELKLLCAAIKSVQDSALGGLSTRGFGKVKIKLVEVWERQAKFYMGDASGEVHKKGEKEIDEWLKQKDLSC